jgi:hypothetical protein
MFDGDEEEGEEDSGTDILIPIADERVGTSSALSRFRTPHIAIAYGGRFNPIPGRHVAFSSTFSSSSSFVFITNRILIFLVSASVS